MDGGGLIIFVHCRNDNGEREDITGRRDRQVTVGGMETWGRIASKSGSAEWTERILRACEERERGTERETRPARTLGTLGIRQLPCRNTPSARRKWYGMTRHAITHPPPCTRQCWPLSGT